MKSDGAGCHSSADMGSGPSTGGRKVKVMFPDPPAGIEWSQIGIVVCGAEEASKLGCHMPAGTPGTFSWRVDTTEVGTVKSSVTS
jgi:hypothetical protein